MGVRCEHRHRGAQGVEPKMEKVGIAWGGLPKQRGGPSWVLIIVGWQRRTDCRLGLIQLNQDRELYCSLHVAPPRIRII
jgi:hypothetical protein